MMTKQLSIIFSLLVLILAPVMAQQTSQPFRDPALPMEKRIDNLLSQMTLDEKIDCLGTTTEYRVSAFQTLVVQRGSTVYSSGAVAGPSARPSLRRSSRNL